MASGDGPPVKKMKTEDCHDDIFVSFHKDKDLLQNLEVALENLKNRTLGYGVGISKIKVCDALSDKCFSRATCHCYYLRKVSGGYSSVPEGLLLRFIFQYGFKVLDAYTNSPGRLPQQKGARLALEKLLKFLSDPKLACKILSKGTEESELTEIVAHHLLSKLAVGSNYTLDNSKGRSRNFHCSCGCKEKLMGKYGDTSMGVPSYWHGRVDIMMDVAMTLATEEPDSSGAENCSSIETETTSDRMIACKEQIRAEAIVFSFLQKKNHPERNNFLIPTIAMSKSKVAVCLYDSENDILFETPRFDLFLEKEFLKIETIITLWLVLNYRYFCSGVPEEIIELGFKADFFKQAEAQLEKYANDVNAPCSYQSENSWIALPFCNIVVKVKEDDVNNIYQPS